MAKIQTGKNISKKEVIIEKAASLFKLKSYNASSMRELADMVGVEAPSLYNHIGSKSELLQAICFKIGNAFTAQVEKIKNSNISTPEKIEAVIRFHIEIMDSNFDEVYVAKTLPHEPPIEWLIQLHKDLPV
jgi:AcrR family transcriptional regulator